MVKRWKCLEQPSTFGAVGDFGIDTLIVQILSEALGKTMNMICKKFYDFYSSNCIDSFLSENFWVLFLFRTLVKAFVFKNLVLVYLSINFLFLNWLSNGFVWWDELVFNLIRFCFCLMCYVCSRGTPVINCLNESSLCALLSYSLDLLFLWPELTMKLCD